MAWPVVLGICGTVLSDLYLILIALVTNCFCIFIFITIHIFNLVRWWSVPGGEDLNCYTGPCGFTF